MSFDNHLPFEIKSMCVESFDVRNKSELIAVFLSGVFDQPIEQRAAVTFRAFAAFRRQVFDFQIFSACQPFGDSESGDGFNRFRIG